MPFLRFSGFNWQYRERTVNIKHTLAMIAMKEKRRDIERCYFHRESGSYIGINAHGMPHLEPIELIRHCHVYRIYANTSNLKGKLHSGCSVAA